MGLVVPHTRWALLAALAGLGCRPAPRPAAPPKPVSLRLVAVGDILMHQDVKRSAEGAQGFTVLWEDVAPLFRAADIAFGNLETPIAPTTGRPGVPFQFNAPSLLPSALRTSGFTVLSTANNHAYDQGRAGVVETLDRLRAEGLLALGSGADQAQAEVPLVLERAGFRVAMLGFTDLFNLDLNRRAAEPWVRPLDLGAAVAAIQAVRPRVDVVVVSVHWGNEYQHLPTRRQRDAARGLVAAGADLVLGHHPHVLQPVELVQAEGRRGLVAYSLGNFISNQDRMYRADRFPVAGGDSRDGAALEVRFERDAPGVGPLHLEARVEPLWTENNWGSPGARTIRVVRVGAAEAKLREELADLGRLPDLDAPRKKDLLEKQEALRTLILRRRRVAETVGEAFAAP